MDIVFVQIFQLVQNVSYLELRFKQIKEKRTKSYFDEHPPPHDKYRCCNAIMTGFKITLLIRILTLMHSKLLLHMHTSRHTDTQTHTDTLTGTRILAHTHAHTHTHTQTDAHKLTSTHAQHKITLTHTHKHTHTYRQLQCISTKVPHKFNN